MKVENIDNVEARRPTQKGWSWSVEELDSWIHFFKQIWIKSSTPFKCDQSRGWPRIARFSTLKQIHVNCYLQWNSHFIWCSIMWERSWVEISPSQVAMLNQWWILLLGTNSMLAKRDWINVTMPLCFCRACNSIEFLFNVPRMNVL